MLFKSFVVSLLMYCLPVLYSSVYALDKKLLQKVFHNAKNIGLDVGDLDVIVEQRTKYIIIISQYRNLNRYKPAVVKQKKQHNKDRK